MTSDDDKAVRVQTEEMMALRQITPPYDWQGWSETLDDIDALPTREQD